MKPESIKCILISYLKERHYSSANDDVDGFPIEASGYLSGEPCDSVHGTANGLFLMGPQLDVLPLDDLDYVPLQSDMEAIATGIGRQLSQLSDEFDLDHTGAVRKKASTNGNRSVHFKEHIIRVPPTCNRIPIPVVRKGPTDKVVNVEWRTCDKSAKAGLHYVSNQGNIVFAEDDEEKTIEIELISSQRKKTDICFSVELFDAEGTFNTFMVYIVDESKLYSEEKQVVENIFSLRKISVSEVANCLSDQVTRNTFKAALLCLCSSTNSIPKELALASELLRLTIPHARLGTLANVFCEYFSDLPELEDLVSLF